MKVSLTILCAAVVLQVSGCQDPEADCSTERCQVWICGESRPQCPCSDLCERPGCADVIVYGRDPATSGCTEFGTPCDVPSDWEYFSTVEECEGGDVMCTNDGQCADDEICDIHSCASDAAGTCVAPPDACSQEEAPVWGCDGEMYTNDCQRLAAGVSLDATGVDNPGCTLIGVWARNPRTGVCSYYASSCLAPDEWEFFFSRDECEGPECIGPVWVFDADHGECVELESSCVATLGAQYFSTQQSCAYAGIPCGPTHECPDSLICNRTTCDNTAAGQCVPVPEECHGAESVPGAVCGCDGITYEDDCERLLAGVALYDTRPCNEGGI